MLKQVMFTCTSKAIKYKPPGLRWVCGPSHLRLTSWKHLASSCHNSIQIPFVLTQAPPLLVEVIPDYRATVVKCWYNVLFLYFYPVLCLHSCSKTAGHLAVLLLYDLLCTELMSHFSLINKITSKFNFDRELLRKVLMGMHGTFSRDFISPRLNVSTC